MSEFEMGLLKDLGAVWGMFFTLIALAILLCLWNSGGSDD